MPKKLTDTEIYDLLYQAQLLFQDVEAETERGAGSLRAIRLSIHLNQGRLIADLDEEGRLFARDLGEI